MAAKRRKSNFPELPDEEFPKPQRTEFAQIPKLPSLEIRLNPRLDEIIAEAGRSRLKNNERIFYRPGEDVVNRK